MGIVWRIIYCKYKNELKSTIWILRNTLRVMFNKEPDLCFNNKKTSSTHKGHKDHKVNVDELFNLEADG